MSSYYEKMLATGEVKCIDEEIPFEIPVGWEWCRFSSLYLSLTDGTHSTPKYTLSGIPFISVKDMSSGVIDFSNTKYISKEEHQKLSDRCHPQKGDLLLSKVGTTGIPAMVTTDREFSLFVSVALIKLIQCDINREFLVFMIQSPLVQEQAKENTRGVGNKNWVLSAVSKTLMVVPPLEEQGRIRNKLNLILPYVERYSSSQDKLDLLNANIVTDLKKSILQEAIQGKLVPQIAEEGTAHELLEQIKAEKQKLVKEGKLKKSALNDSVIFRGDDNKYYEQIGNKCLDITEQIPFEIPNSWTWTKLSCVTSVYTGNSISETEKQAKFTNVQGRYYIGTKDVGFNNKIVYNNGISIPLQYEQDFRIAPANSILMCIEGGSAGKKIAILNQDVCFGNKLCCFAPFWEIGKFIYYYLQSPSFVELFNLNKTGIIGGVSVAKVKEIVIPLPPVMEQQRIVAQIDRLFEQLR